MTLPYSSLIPITSNTVAETVFSMTGLNIFYAAGNQLYYYNGATNQLIAENPLNIGGILENGRQIIYTLIPQGEQDGELFLFDGINGVNNRLTSNNSQNDGLIELSGNSFVYVKTVNDQPNLYLYNEAGEFAITTDSDANERLEAMLGNLVVYSDFVGQNRELIFFNGAIGTNISNNGSPVDEIETYETYTEPGVEKKALTSDYVVFKSIQSNTDDDLFVYTIGSGTRPLTSNTRKDNNLEGISGRNIIYTNNDGDPEIYLYDGVSVIPLTNNTTNDIFRGLFGDYLVIQGSPGIGLGTDQELLLSNLNNPQSFIQLTTNNTYSPNNSSSFVRILANGVIGFVSNQSGDTDIYVYNPNGTEPALNLTNDSDADNGFESPSSPDTDEPISPNYFVWKNNGELFAHNGFGTIQLTNNGQSEDELLDFSGRNIIYRSRIGQDYELFVFNGNQVIQLTNNDTDDVYLKSEGDTITWRNNDGIYLYNGLTSLLVNDPSFTVVEISQANVLLGGNGELFVSVPIFDATQYLASYPDLIAAFGFNPPAAEAHYFNVGRFEGRAADSFDGLRYIASNPDLIQAGFRDENIAAIHWITAGLNEGRSLTAFDPIQYLATYPDLITAFDYNPPAATSHYINSGFFEGRIPDGFDERRYLATNPDVWLAGITDATGAAQHWIISGLAEGRSPNRFNEGIYLASYDDLLNAFGNNTQIAYDHALY